MDQTMNITKEEILNVVKIKGPIIPLDIKRELQKGDTVIIGAYLSQLIHTGEVKITNVKIGGSPFYYTSNQQQKLEPLHQYLNEKDKRTYIKLKENKILRDKKLEPLERVSLRNTPDFSKKIIVSIQGEKEIFWRHFLITEEEGINIIKSRLTKKNTTPNTETKKIETPQKTKEEQTQPIKQTTLQTQEEQSEFEQKISTYFQKQEIIITEKEIVRKNSEYNFKIKIKTSLGLCEFYCKARNKKKIPDGDIAEAYLEGLIKRSPTVFITTGTVSKKSKEKITTHYKGLIIKEI